MEVMHHSTLFLLPKVSAPDPSLALDYALVILNQSLPRSMPLLWDHAIVRVCADGGANRLFDEMPKFFPEKDPLEIRNKYIPNVIKGDMDSVRKDVLDFYAKLGCNAINESHDQDTTDLNKCISHISNLMPDAEKRLLIVVAGALGGRFDHEAGNINVLYHFPSLRIVFVSDDCLIHLLPKSHHHKIHIAPSTVGPHCGLLPIGTPALHTTTTGLKWDLNDQEMRFGDLISTSNLVKGDIISVQSDADLIWTISIKRGANFKFEGC